MDPTPLPVKVLFFIAICGMLTACSNPESRAIRFALASAPVNLDPRFATDATSERINRLLYTRLVDFDEQARPVPALATWQVLAPLHYRFHLGEQGRHFHDGSRLDTADVAATFASILEPDSISPHRGTLQKIDRIEIIDADTLDFYLRTPDLLFPGYLSIGILPQEGIVSGARFQNHPLGSGPFRFLSWPSAGHLELQRIEDGQRLVFEQVRDPTMRILKLLRGEVDLLQNDLPPELLHYLEQQDEIQVTRIPGNNFSYLGFQLEDADTGREEVRRAIALAIDRAAIIHYVFDGAARPAASLLPPEHWAGAKQLDLFQPDPDQARALLQAAGYSAEHPLKLSYKTSSDPFRIRIATILQEQLSRVGIEVLIQSYDWGTFYGDIKSGRFQMYSLAWVGVKSPDIFRYAFHSGSLPPGGANRGRLKDARADELITLAMNAGDMQQQAQWYARLQHYLLQRLPYVPLWYEDQYFASRPGVSGYELTPDGDYDALVSTLK